MQKHFRAGIGNTGNLAAGTMVFAEALNPHFGYFYTVNKILASQKTKYQSLQLLDSHEFGKVLATQYSGEDCEIEAEIPESLQRRLAARE